MRKSNQIFSPYANETTLFLHAQSRPCHLSWPVIVTGMLTRDLFAVANFLFITFYSDETVALMCV